MVPPWGRGGSASADFRASEPVDGKRGGRRCKSSRPTASLRPGNRPRGREGPQGGGAKRTARSVSVATSTTEKSTARRAILSRGSTTPGEKHAEAEGAPSGFSDSLASLAGRPATCALSNLDALAATRPEREAGLSSGEEILLFADGRTTDALWRTGQPARDPLRLDIRSARLSPAGRVVAEAVRYTDAFEYTSVPHAVVAIDGRRFDTVARVGDASPDGGVFCSVGGARINDAGDVAFAASVASRDGTVVLQRSPLEQLLRRRPDGLLERVVLHEQGGRMVSLVRERRPGANP
jgi:hypothetical protein